jgi:hypothetical protein
LGLHVWRDAGTSDDRARDWRCDIRRQGCGSAYFGGGILDRRMVRIEGQLRAAFGVDPLPFFFVFLTVAIPPHRLDEELHPVLVLVLAIAQLVVDANDGLRDFEDVACGRELVEDVA